MDLLVLCFLKKFHNAARKITVLSRFYPLRCRLETFFDLGSKSNLAIVLLKSLFLCDMKNLNLYINQL